MPESVAVLLIEDDPNDALLFERAISDVPACPALKVVSDIESAQSYFRGHGQYADRALWPMPRLILLDLNLGNTRGTDFLIWAKAHPRFKRIPIVVVTGSISPATVGEILSLGANAVMQKPLGLDQLRSVLTTACEFWLCIAIAPEPIPERRAALQEMIV